MRRIRKNAPNGDEVRSLRSQLGLTQSELSLLVTDNGDGSNIRAWERGLRPIPKSVELLLHLAIEFECARKKLGLKETL